MSCIEMIKIRFLSIISLLFILYLSNFCNASLKEKPLKNIHTNNKRNKFRENIKSTERFSRRKLDENNLTFVPLSIYLETAEFNETIPTNLIQYKDNFIIAMNKAKEILEDLLEIMIDLQIKSKFNATYINESWGILNFNYNYESNINFREYNYFIFFKFIDLHRECASIILEDYAQIPFVGIILFNKNIKESLLTVDYLTNLMLHRYIKLLGFSDEMNGVPNTQNIPIDLILEEDGEINSFPNLFNFARKYFNCPTINQIELVIDEENENEDDDGDNYKYLEYDITDIYWPKRYFLGEIMTKFDYPEEQILSGFTLAFLDDLGYLNVTKNYMGGGLMKFGKNKGCEFFNDQCGSSSISSNEFYLPNASPSNVIEPSCSSGRLSKTIYILQEIDYESDIAPEFDLDGKGGPESTNFCPIAQYDYESSVDRYIYNGHCYDIEHTDTDEKRHEKLSNNSFCVLSSLKDNEEDDSNYKALCYEMFCSSLSLTIKIGDYYIVCPREGGQVKAKYFEGYLLCPDYNLICTSQTLCNNLFNCLDNNSEEKNETFDYEYTIKTTQDPSVHNVENPEINYGWELTENEGKCPYLCMQCKSRTDCERCQPHYKYENDKCIYAIEHCIDFNDLESDVCVKCDDGYYLAEVNESYRYCTDSVENYYLYNSELEIYKKCDLTIENCNKCEFDEDAELKCTLCEGDFKKIYGGIECGDLSTKKYYEETDGTYKPCISYDNTCYKCEKEGASFKCLECIEDYVLFYGDNEISCKDKTLLDDTMFTNRTDKKIYYSCNEYNNIENCNKCNKQEECNDCIDEYAITNGNKLCILITDIEDKKYYQDPDNNYYYKCSHSLENCIICDDKTKCIRCEDSYVLDERDTCIPYSLVEQNFYYLDETINKYSSCSKILNCLTCSSSTNCISCKTDYYFVQNNVNQISCQNILDINKYYKNIVEGKEIYKKCSDSISNCEQCSSNNYCTKCDNNYAIIENDHTKCENLLTEKYYHDTDLNKFTLCSNKLANCELCSTYGQFICKKCLSDYALKHESDIQCSEKINLISNKKYYTNDSNINYYSCFFYNKINSCEECTNQETCNKCISPYKMFNEGTNYVICALESDVNNNLYNYNNEGILSPCSSLIPDCNKCNNSEVCYECKGNAGLIDNDTCLPEEKIKESQNYFKDEINNRYISCSIIENCITCESSNKCLTCQNGYEIMNNICKEIVNGDNNKNKALSTGAIVGIVFGCLGFLLLVAGTAYFLMNKFFKKNIIYNNANIENNNRVTIEEENKDEEPKNEVKDIENNNKYEVIVHTTKRSIRNEKG